MTTGKTIVLTRRTFVGKVMSLLFNMLSRLVITFLPRSKRLFISWLQLLQGKPFNITVIQVYAQTSNAEEAEAKQFYEDLQELLELTLKKDALFIIGNWNAKVGSQETPGVTGKFGLGVQNEAGVLPRKCTGQSKHPLPTTQEKTLHMDITRWSTPKLD